MLQAQLGIHRFEPSVFIFQFTQAMNIRGFHAAVPGFPFVETALAEPIGTAEVAQGNFRFRFFQDSDGLVSVKRDCFMWNAPGLIMPKFFTFVWHYFRGWLPLPSPYS